MKFPIIEKLDSLFFVRMGIPLYRCSTTPSQRMSHPLYLNLGISFNPVEVVYLFFASGDANIHGQRIEKKSAVT